MIIIGDGKALIVSGSDSVGGRHGGPSDSVLSLAVTEGCASDFGLSCGFVYGSNFESSCGSSCWSGWLVRWLVKWLVRLLVRCLVRFQVRLLVVRKRLVSEWVDECMYSE